MRVQLGSAESFARVACVGGIDANDVDDHRDMRAELRRRLHLALPSLPDCNASQGPILQIAYQAGRGICVDCGSTGSKWSGFAFLTVDDATGTEIARCEWTGGGGADGAALLGRFADDLIALLKSTRSAPSGAEHVAW